MVINKMQICFSEDYIAVIEEIIESTIPCTEIPACNDLFSAPRIFVKYCKVY